MAYLSDTERDELFERSRHLPAQSPPMNVARLEFWHLVDAQGIPTDAGIVVGELVGELREAREELARLRDET